MREDKTQLIYLKNIFLFLLFGFIISLSTIYINYSYQYEEIEQKVQEDSKFTSEKIQLNIQTHLDKIEHSIESINSNELFFNYLLNPNKNTKKNVEQLFLVNMHNHLNFFQFRFINESGMEKIRVQRNRSSNEVYIVEEKNLQNKAHRYYFKKTIIKNKDSYWYSNLDLNMENGKIEKPIRPTLRIAQNVVHKGKFYGILIVNIDMEGLLNYIAVNNQFNIYLVDSEGYFIIHPDEKKSWSKYLSKKFTMHSEFPDSIKEKNIFSYPLEHYFHNGEKIQLLLELKESYFNELLSQNYKILLTISVLVFIISILVGLIISVPTSRLHIGFNKLYKDNLKYLDIIDKHVITMKVDTNRKIVEVSEELCKVSGYSKNELIGHNPNILKSGRMDIKIYQDLWNKISNGFIWSGELENRTKDGEPFWIQTTIIPNFANDTIESYTSISENITDKKIIEKISQTDKLTQIYNRVKLDESLDNAIKKYTRYKNLFSLILVDIDHFKAINDTFGHHIGDIVLVKIAKLLDDNIRELDILGRWGGEEFLIICTNTDIQGAVNLAEKLKSLVGEFEFNRVGYQTISLGVTQIREEDDITSLITRVDNYLYQSKDNGRNQVTSDLNL